VTHLSIQQQHKQGGFTLLESLISLLIFTTAAITLLTHLQGLTLHAVKLDDRHQKNQAVVMQSTFFSAAQIWESALDESGTVALTTPNFPALPPVYVDNFDTPINSTVTPLPQNANLQGFRFGQDIGLPFTLIYPKPGKSL